MCLYKYIHAVFVLPRCLQHGGDRHCAVYKQPLHLTACKSAHTDRTEQNSDDSQPARQAAVFMHYQPVTKYFVVITTKLRDVYYHNSEHIISSSLNNMSSSKTEESATEMQNDHHTIRYKKFSSYIRVTNYDLQNYFSPL